MAIELKYNCRSDGGPLSQRGFDVLVDGCWMTEIRIHNGRWALRLPDEDVDGWLSSDAVLAIAEKMRELSGE